MLPGVLELLALVALIVNMTSIMGPNYGPIAGFVGNPGSYLWALNWGCRGLEVQRVGAAGMGETGYGYDFLGANVLFFHSLIIQRPAT